MKKEVREYLIKVLSLLEERSPTEEANHNFQLSKDGRLWLWVMIEDDSKWQSISFDDEDNSKSPEELVDGIMESLREAGYSV